MSGDLAIVGNSPPGRDDHMVDMKRELTLLSAAALVLAACGGGGDEAIETENAWARTSPMATTIGAAYLDITAADDDVLLGASVPAAVAGSAEVHEIVEADPGTDDESMEESMDHGSMDHGSMDDESMDIEEGEEAMVMREMADGLALPAGETVSLDPGGYHVMLLDLVEPLETGDEFELTLDFEDADDVTVIVTVAETAPGS